MTVDAPTYARLDVAEWAYGLMLCGVNPEIIVTKLVSIGIALPLAAAITQEASERFRRQQRADGNKNLLIGTLLLLVGLLITGVSYAAADGGRFLIATGAILYGLMKLIKGLFQGQTAKVTPARMHRFACFGTALLAVLIGAVMISLSVVFAAAPRASLDEQIVQWLMLAGGYLALLLAIVPLIDTHSLRPRVANVPQALLVKGWITEKHMVLLILFGCALAFAHVSWQNGGWWVSTPFLSPLWPAPPSSPL